MSEKIQFFWFLSFELKIIDLQYTDPLTKMTSAQLRQTIFYMTALSIVGPIPTIFSHWRIL